VVRLDFKVHPKMLTSILQGRALGEADVRSYWKPEEVSFLLAGVFHPEAVVVPMKVTQLCAGLSYFQDQGGLFGPSAANKFGLIL